MNVIPGPSRMLTQLMYHRLKWGLIKTTLQVGESEVRRRKNNAEEKARTLKPDYLTGKYMARSYNAKSSRTFHPFHLPQVSKIV